MLGMNPYYEYAGITIYHGDEREVLPSLPAETVDLVVTSPPYNLGNTSGGGFPNKARLGHYDSDNRGMGKRGGVGKWRDPALANGYGDYDDNLPHPVYVAWQQDMLRRCWRLLGPAGAIYYNHKQRVLSGVVVTPLEYVPLDLPVRQIVIWARSGGINFSPAFYCPTHEWIVIVAKPDFRLKSKGASGVGDVWYIPQQADPSHPAPFPSAIPERAIETTAPRMVLDPFCGRGTTLRAAKDAGVCAIGIDLDERNCELSARRCDQEVLALA